MCLMISCYDRPSIKIWLLLGNTSLSATNNHSKIVVPKLTNMVIDVSEIYIIIFTTSVFWLLMQK